jgi:hypothetical protein
VAAPALSARNRHASACPPEPQSASGSSEPWELPGPKRPSHDDHQQQPVQTHSGPQPPPRCRASSRGLAGLLQFPSGTPTGTITGTIDGRDIQMHYERTDIATDYEAWFYGTLRHCLALEHQPVSDFGSSRPKSFVA